MWDELVEEVKVISWKWLLGRFNISACMFYEWCWSSRECLLRRCLFVDCTWAAVLCVCSRLSSFCLVFGEAAVMAAGLCFGCGQQVWGFFV
ncbi:hypothetical protein MtrunA17_Chr4g0051451 [Medicago truncatula]|uniref:Uncharacterized protein n=1 Tax=Medicago truncatula TaxID=3880 RepID=A0A396IDA5_MEDTR|nr:hypothetical protein MtrunA17_Chr4g0051451 [Medicago truncatula]